MMIGQMGWEKVHLIRALKHLVARESHCLLGPLDEHQFLKVIVLPSGLKYKMEYSLLCRKV